MQNDLARKMKKVLEKRRNLVITSRRDGFTLIEILVVIAVISMLAGMLMVSVGKIRTNAAIKVSQSMIDGISVALEAYKVDFGDYPPDDYSDSGGDTAAVSNPAECLAFFLTREIRTDNTANTGGSQRLYNASINREPYMKDLHENMTEDITGDGWPELVDGFGNPFIYNRGQFLANRIAGPAIEDKNNLPAGQRYPLHNKQGYDLFFIGKDEKSNGTTAPASDGNFGAFMTGDSHGEDDDDFNNWGG